MRAFNEDGYSSSFKLVMFYALWNCGTIFISIISFFTYVMLGNQLTTYYWRGVHGAFPVIIPSFFTYLNEIFSKQVIALFNLNMIR